jgi:LysR family transcriptional regulator, glycine cleavage system transcriptional activator
MPTVRSRPSGKTKRSTRSSRSTRPALPARRPARHAEQPAASKAARAAYRRAPLASLRVFVAVSEHCSFTRAADTLGMTTSAVSVHMQALEDYLRTPVFRRDGRQVVLTSAGAALLPKVERALADLECAIDEARADRGDGPLRVSTLAFFLAQWLLPRLPGFTALHPDIDVQIHTSADSVDFVKTGLDAGIRLGTGVWPRLHAEKLIDEWLVPVCTPTLLERQGAVSEARDLQRYRLIHSPYEPWTAWLLDGTQDDVWPSSGAAFDDAVAIVRATQAGQGLSLARWSLVADEVSMRRLAVAGRAVRSTRSYYFVCPQQHLGLAKVAAFRAWLHDECGRFPPPPRVKE